jgi:hypothetical protein
MKLDGILVCNEYFVVAMAYSRSGVEQLKKSIVVFSRITSIQRNSYAL